MGWVMRLTQDDVTIGSNTEEEVSVDTGNEFPN